MLLPEHVHLRRLHLRRLCVAAHRRRWRNRLRLLELPRRRRRSRSGSRPLLLCSSGSGGRRVARRPLLLLSCQASLSLLRFALAQTAADHEMTDRAFSSSENSSSRSSSSSWPEAS
jgi:hypothetical protein